MQFKSLAFVLFFSATFVLYWLLPRRLQNWVLLVGSYIFYGVGGWWLMLLLATSTGVDYVAAGKIADARDGGGRGRGWLAASLTVQLGILGVFKYFNFFSDSVTSLLRLFDVTVPRLYLDIGLPAGISFYTFKTISYTVDVYRGHVQPTRSLLQHAVHMSFFPSLLAGPIARASESVPQFEKPRIFDCGRMLDGIHLVFWGMFKKVFIADNLARLVAPLFAAATPTGCDALLGSYLFALEIYCDFSGYTDTARGLAKCLGIELPFNFRYPYLSRNPSEFWQRWHISFSTWIRDYIFVSMGGAWGGNLRAYRNLAVTMVLAGLWHGASWVFVLWGAYQGALLIGHRVAEPWLKAAGRPMRRVVGKGPRKVFKRFVTFHLVCLGWLLFRSATVSQAGQMLLALFSGFGAVDFSRFLPLLYFGAPLLLVEGLEIGFGRDDIFRVRRIPLVAKTAVYATFTYLMLFRGAVSESYIYTQF